MKEKLNNMLKERNEILIECNTLKNDNYSLKRLNEKNIDNYQKELEIMECSIHLKSHRLNDLEKLLKQKDEEKIEQINLNNAIKDEYEDFKKNKVSIIFLYLIEIVSNRLLFRKKYWEKVFMKN